MPKLKRNGGVPAFWEASELEVVRRARQIGQLTTVALRVIRRMPGEVVEICGPISTGGCGSMEGNLERFRQAIEILPQRHPEFSVFNQLPFQTALIRLTERTRTAGQYCHEILYQFYRPIFQSGLITRGFFLSDWESSIGATWEREEMERENIHIREFPDSWFK